MKKTLPKIPDKKEMERLRWALLKGRRVGMTWFYINNHEFFKSIDPLEFITKDTKNAKDK